MACSGEPQAPIVPTRALVRAATARFWRAFTRPLATCRHSRYFLLLGVVVALLGAGIILFGHWGAFERKAFDLFMRARLHAPVPHPDIVIVNVDERSLAEMAPDYGRWSWPRRVLAELIQHIEAQGPRAILLDVMIADPDVQNPDSEAAFDAMVRTAPNVFYPSIRLPGNFDAASTLTVDRVPGVLAQDIPGAKAGRVAMLLPYLDSILASGRVGTTNLLADRDGVAREAYLHHGVGAWNIPSLPAIVATHLGATLPSGDRILLNWRGPPGTYPNVGFSAVYLDSLRQVASRPADEFRGKVVLIGSSAAGLFDLRPTPVSATFPGTEVLATALDNILRNDYVRRPPPWLAVFLSSGFVLGLAWMFALQRHDWIGDSSFLLLQLLVGVAAFAVLHLAPIYIDVSAPITFGTLYFGLARASLTYRTRWAANWLRDEMATKPAFVHVLRISASTPCAKDMVGLRRILARGAGRSRLRVSQLSPPTDSLGMLAPSFEGELGLIWFVIDGADEDTWVRAETDRLITEFDRWAVARSITLQHRVYSFIIPGADSSDRLSRFRQVMEIIFANTPEKAPEPNNEK